MLGLEGTDFSPEDVIGDDLRKMDAQIASFQRRIDGTREGGWHCAGIWIGPSGTGTALRATLKRLAFGCAVLGEIVCLIWYSCRSV